MTYGKMAAHQSGGVSASRYHASVGHAERCSQRRVAGVLVQQRPNHHGEHRDGGDEAAATCEALPFEILQLERERIAEQHGAAEDPRRSPVAEDERRHADEASAGRLTLVVDAWTAPDSAMNAPASPDSVPLMITPTYL